MKKRPQPVSINILGKEYKIACEESEKEALIESAKELDQQMRKIRDSGKVASHDRIAVMAALNLTHELRQNTQTTTSPVNSINSTLIKLRQKIENALENS